MQGPQEELVGRAVRAWHTGDRSGFPFRAVVLSIGDGLVNLMSLEPSDAALPFGERSRWWVPVANFGVLDVVSKDERERWEAEFIATRGAMR